MNKGIWQSVIVLMVVLLSVTNVSHAKTKLASAELLDIEKVSSGIFRGSRSTANRKTYRIDSAPYAGNSRLKRHSKKSTVAKGRMRVRLSAKIPKGLGIRNSEVQWQVKSKNGKGAAVTKGKQATVRLLPGKYTVKLRIGSYTNKKTITIRKNRNNTQLVPMSANLGLLNISSSVGNVKNTKKVHWTVKNTQGTVIATAVGNRIRHLVPAGRYKVEARYDKAKRGRNVTVKHGASSGGVIDLPAGRIRLSAFNKSIREPLFEKTRWVVYDSENQVVMKAKKHNLRMTLFPGKYRAQLTARGKVTHKNFSVSAGKNADVKLIIR